MKYTVEKWKQIYTRTKPIYSMLQIGRDIARNDVVKRLGIDCFNKITFDLLCDITGRKASTFGGCIHWNVS